MERLHSFGCCLGFGYYLHLRTVPPEVLKRLQAQPAPPPETTPTDSPAQRPEAAAQ